ncbi:MAG: hypothetical protein QOF21_2673 [Actinomycetota bacterium]
MGRAANDAPVDIANLQLVVLDVAALAATLASTRPAEERAALDIRGRVGGDLAALGEALGARPNDANDRTTAIAAEWERELDPAVLAFSGAGDCEELGTILDDAPLESVADLLAIAPTAAAHAQDCVACSDRMRAMNSVRSFFSAGAADVPAEVRDASRLSRRLRPSAAPPPLFGDAGRVTRWRDVGTPSRFAAIAAVLVIALGGLWVTLDRQDERDQSLTKAAASPLVIATNLVNGYATGLSVHNPTDRTIRLRITSTEKWAKVSPDRGTVGPGATVSFSVLLSGAAPEGDARSTVVVTTAAGATTSKEFVWDIRRPPEIGTEGHGCDVTVNAVDPGGDLVSLVLHWRDTSADHVIDITQRADGYQTTLEPQGSPITYWVTAADGHGNEARTMDQIIPGDAC